MKYNIKNPKDVHIDIKADKLFKIRLKQLAEKRNQNMSKIIRELLEKEYNQEFTK